MSWGKTGKALVVGSSLLLGGAYVGYRHQEQKKESAGKKAVLPGSKNPAFSGDRDPRRVTVLPSSKNIDAVLANPNRQGTSGDSVLPEYPGGTQTERFLLPGSKMGEVVRTRDAGAINRNNIDAVLADPNRNGASDDFIDSIILPETPEQREIRRALLSSSKSGAIFKAKDAETNKTDNPGAAPDSRQQTPPPEKEPPP